MGTTTVFIPTENFQDQSVAQASQILTLHSFHNTHENKVSWTTVNAVINGMENYLNKPYSN